MSQDVGGSTYRRYKEDTNTFTAWLSRAAKACGWKPTQKPTEILSMPIVNAVSLKPKGPRLKGKARKEAKESAKAAPAMQISPPLTDSTQSTLKYTLTTQDILVQAEMVAHSARRKQSMPDSIRIALQRAISARERCAAWFEKTMSSSQESRESHRHFIDILKAASDLLKGTMQDQPGTVTTKEPVQRPDSSETREEKDMKFMANMFAALEVEDVPEDDYDDDALTPSQPSHDSTPKRCLYELGTVDKWELDFAIYSLFEDLHRLREEMRRTWTRFKEGEITLIHATLSTAVCLELVRLAEEEVYKMFLSVFPESENLSYVALVNKIYNSDALGRANEHGIDDPEALAISAFDEFIFIPVGRTLLNLKGMKGYVNNIMWPVPIPSLRFDYIVAPELIDDPRMKKFEEQDRFLVQIYHDLVLVDHVKFDTFKMEKLMGGERAELMKKAAQPFDDVLHSSLRCLWNPGSVTVQSVFAAQLILDIHDICGTATSGLQLVQDAINHMFPFSVDSNGALDTKEVRWPAEDQDVLMEIHRRLQYWLIRPPWMVLKEVLLGLSHKKREEEIPPEVDELIYRWLDAHGLSPPSAEENENAEKLNVQFIYPNDEPAFLINNSPLYCGTVLLDLISMTEKAGVALANRHWSVFGVAHVYNALRQLGGFDKHWPEIERIIALHPGPLFANDVPTTATSIYDRFAYRIGASPSNLRHFVKKRPWNFHTTPATAAMRQFFEAKLSLPQLLNLLEEQMSAHDHQNKQQRRIPESSRLSNHSLRDRPCSDWKSILTTSSPICSWTTSTSAGPAIGCSGVCGRKSRPASAYRTRTFAATATTTV